MNKKRQGGPGYEKLFGDQIFGWGLPYRYDIQNHSRRDGFVSPHALDFV